MILFRWKQEYLKNCGYDSVVVIEELNNFDSTKIKSGDGECEAIVLGVPGDMPTVQIFFSDDTRNKQAIFKSALNDKQFLDLK